MVVAVGDGGAMIGGVGDEDGFGGARWMLACATRWCVCLVRVWMLLVYVCCVCGVCIFGSEKGGSSEVTKRRNVRERERA
jgi:hypothetical protein